MSGAGEITDGAALQEDHLLHDWPPRPWLLAGLLALAGFLIHLLSDNGDTEVPARIAAAVAIGFAGVAAALTLDKGREREALAFSAIVGLVMGGIAWHVVRMDERVAGVEFAFAAGVFFSVLAVPLFQAGFHRTRFATDYKATHFHVWADAVSGAGALAFVGLSWLMLLLAHGLFEIVGLEFLGDLMEEGAFAWAWSGAAFGAALGLIRNNLKIVGALQGVVMLVLGLLAVPLALALLVFLVALLASGGQALWDATDSATPILLACAVGCFVLTNAIIRDSDAERSGNKVLQITALVLAAGVLPLTLFAAISMGIRIDQYGLAPERIWALIAIVIACAYGLAYWVGLARGRLAAWSHYLRRANLHLAAVTCMVALLLALPLVDFGGISARNQVARLDAGKVSAEEFDYAALRWDFGDAGRKVLADLAGREGEVATLAKAAQAQTERPYGWARENRREEDFNLRVHPEDPAIREFMLARLRAEPFRCRELCMALDLGPGADGRHRIALIEGYGFETFTMGETDGTATDGAAARVESGSGLAPDSTVEIRTIPRRYIVIDGVPMREPIEDEVPAPAPPTQ